MTFDEIFSRHIKREGGYINDPNDPGGETVYGISRRYNPSWPGWEKLDAGAPVDLLLDDARAFYGALWRQYRIDQLPDAVRPAVFDAVAGPIGPRGVEILQLALHALGQDPGPIDGVVGETTIAAAQRYRDPEVLAQLIEHLKVLYLLVGSRMYRKFAEAIHKRKDHLARFLRGWLRRASH